MAHRTNVTPAMRGFDPAQLLEKVTDPVCGTIFVRKDSRFMVFRPEGAYYFCSQACQLKFLASGTEDAPEDIKDAS